MVKISLEFVSESPYDNKSSMVQVVALSRFRPEPMLPLDVLWRHMTSIDLNELLGSFGISLQWRNTKKIAAVTAGNIFSKHEWIPRQCYPMGGITNCTYGTLEWINKLRVFTSELAAQLTMWAKDASEHDQSKVVQWGDSNQNVFFLKFQFVLTTVFLQTLSAYRNFAWLSPGHMQQHVFLIK